MIKEIHKFVLLGREGAGEYRQEQVYIGDAFNVDFTPCPPNEIEEQISQYVKEIQKDMLINKQIRTGDTAPIWTELFHNLAKHHIEFERIHPFIDGNGRTGRLLLVYEMIYTGLLPVDIRVEQAKRYYAGFNTYEQKRRYSSNPKSKTEGMAKLLAESELRSMEVYYDMFANFMKDERDI
jgi:Fic family protein